MPTDGALGAVPREALWAGLMLGAVACATGLGATARWHSLRQAAPLRLQQPSAEVWLEGLPVAGQMENFALVRLPREARLEARSAYGEPDGEAKTARLWGQQSSCPAIVFNAGFYGRGGEHVGWLKTDGRWRQPKRRDDWYGLLLAGPQAENLPAFQLLDLQPGTGGDVVDASAVASQYAHAMQTMMLFDENGALRTRHSPRKAARCALGIDHEGRLLIALSEGALRLGELAEALRAPHLGLLRAVNLDGGLEAQLAVLDGQAEHELLSVHSGHGALPAAVAPQLSQRALPSVWLALPTECGEPNAAF